MKPLELYVHIPFCAKKCNYCDFLSGTSDVRTRGAYTKALCEEIVMWGDKFKNEYELSTIFIGGGTPSFLELEMMEEILMSIRKNFAISGNVEWSMEMNPGSATQAAINSYVSLGVNRFSIGLQSANDVELKTLGRIHTFDKFLHTYEMVRNANVENVNVDLMYSIPGQSVASFKHTIQSILRIKPEHISAYSLIIEEGTPFYDRYKFDAVARHAGMEQFGLPTEEEEILMQEELEKMLSDAGYKQYEVSNFAKAGYECRHNKGYWQRVPYLGVGCGSSSFMEETRWSNERDLMDYIAKPYDAVRNITPIERKDAMAEFMYLGLRMKDGVTRADFRNMFGVEIEAVYADVLANLEEQKMLVQKEGRIYLTHQGMDLSNQVLAEFL